MYEYVSKASPFLVLAALGLFDGCKIVVDSCRGDSTVLLICLVLQLAVMKPGVASEPIAGPSFKTLLKDPYILLAAGKHRRRSRRERQRLCLPQERSRSATSASR